MSSSMFPRPWPCHHVLFHGSMSSSMFPCPRRCFRVQVHFHVHVYFVSPYCKRKTELKEKGNFRLFAGDRNGKRKFFFLDRQTINGNRLLLCQQTCHLCVLVYQVRSVAVGENSAYGERVGSDQSLIPWSPTRAWSPSINNHLGLLLDNRWYLNSR
jgi:hypothetical protein